MQGGGFVLELVLIRHGETAGNLRPTALGITDLPLTERGRRQASTLARVFKLGQPEVIYSSPLMRAKETAEQIAKLHNMQVESLYDLMERNFGFWENCAVDAISKEYPEEYAAWQNDLVDFQIPGGESARAHYERLTQMVDDLLRRHTEGRVILVTHLGCIRHILAYLLGMGIEGSWHFAPGTGSICRVQIDENRKCILTSFNEI